MFIAYIDECMEEMRREERALIESDRKDEANLVRIRMNIFDIAKTVFGVVVKGNESTDAETVYLQKMEAISESWRVSYQKAKEHDDVKKLVIEEIKLKAYEEIREKFMEKVNHYDGSRYN